jgi:hypothetical protein
MPLTVVRFFFERQGKTFAILAFVNYGKPHHASRKGFIVKGLSRIFDF